MSGVRQARGHSCLLGGHTPKSIGCEVRMPSVRRHHMIRSLLLLVLVAGCSSTPSTGASGSPSEISPSAGTTPDASPSPSASSHSPGGPCQAGSVSETARRGQVPAPLCLEVGATLRVGAEPSPRQPWMPLTSSDEAVLRCVSRPAPGGSIDATCTAVRPGSATVSTVTAPFAGDPHGPPQFRWALEVTVVQAPS